MVGLQARVLVVDDDVEMIALVQEVLSLIPCEVLAAADGEEAMHILHQEIRAGRSVDVVLLDVLLPGEDGFRILSKMKADPHLERIPVILITGLDSVEAKARGLQMGADDYVIKPFDPQELIARVGVVLRIRRTEQMLRRRNEELAALDEINRTISSSLDLDQVLVSALEGLERLVSPHAVAVVLSDEESDSWVVRTARTPQGTWLEGRIVPADEPVLASVLRASKAVLQRNVTSSFWNRTLDAEALDILGVPLLRKRETAGALLILNLAQTPMEEDYIALVEHIAATVAVAVQNARLFQESESFAQALERSQNQLIQAEKMAAVGRLAASLAHEINNPLQAVQNSLHLALHPTLSEEKRRGFLEMAQHEVERLVQIVRQMLDFYRPASAIRLPIDINRPVKEALALASKRLQQSHIQLTVRLAADLPPVLGSANRLSQVFLNIIINAIEAMPNGGRLWVGTAYHAERQQVVAAFRDSGPGIPSEVRDRLFEPFHTTKSGGLGLGLAISYGIVKEHGGDIDVESPEGGGTTFIVRLPVYREESDAEGL